MHRFDDILLTVKVSPRKGEIKELMRLDLSVKTKTKQSQPWFFLGHGGPPKNAWLKMADKTPLPVSVDVACLTQWGENKEAAQQA